MKKKYEKAPAWAFEVRGELVYWAHPSRQKLIEEAKEHKAPLSIYKPVPVYIVRRKDLSKKRTKK